MAGAAKKSAKISGGSTVVAPGWSLPGETMMMDLTP
jgi:hypothetical protein